MKEKNRRRARQAKRVKNKVNKKAIYYGIYDTDWFDSSAVENFSPNIIELIEVGDYVNGKEVHKYNGNTGIVSINELGWTFIAFKDKKYPIETIVTREQFASMEYKVGE